MKKISFAVSTFLLVTSIYAQDEKISESKEKVEQKQSVGDGRLDTLDMQSKEFFKAITGLENDYLEEQANEIKNAANQGDASTQERVISKEEHERNVFRNQSELARVTEDFARTKLLRNFRIKSMYSFNNENFVVLIELNANRRVSNDELSSNIEGRYKKGDMLLGHEIVDINKRTKNIKLYKQIDDNNAYYIYISNHAIDVSSLIKLDEEKLKKEAEDKLTKEIEERLRKEAEEESKKIEDSKQVNESQLAQDETEEKTQEAEALDNAAEETEISSENMEENPQVEEEINTEETNTEETNTEETNTEETNTEETNTEEAEISSETIEENTQAEEETTSEETNTKETLEENKEEDENKIKNIFEKVTKNDACLYEVKAYSLNVRVKNDYKARIARVLKAGDKFSISESSEDKWALVDTIYRASGEVMDLKGKNNWLRLLNSLVKKDDSTCAQENYE